jgi:phosphatidylglycerol:prolipoprotein diacylglycerol transferase
MFLSINFPSFISPEIIPGLPFRWYGLMYIFAFGTAYFLYRKQIAERHFPMDEDTLSNMFFWCVLALLLGARIFSTLVYEPIETNIYLKKPWLIFWPFRSGQFTGLQGMSYHGGVIGGALGIIIWSKRNHYDLREIGDMYACAIPLGYTFGRLGNFINGELFGRVTDSPLGMIFPIPRNDSINRFRPNIEWVRDMAEKAGITIPSDMNTLVNLPRHPSQLYEMFFEGIVLFFVLWFLRNKKPFKGFLIGAYLAGYGIIRFVIEYFRQPDSELGYRIQLGQVVGIKDIAHLHPLLSFSTGQILSFVMIVAAVIWWIIASKLPNNKAIYVYSETSNEESTAKKKPNKNVVRNLRKKLK